MAALCEVASCGVLAIGRCAPCGRAMCTSHRALDRNGPIADHCVECAAARLPDRILASDQSRLAHGQLVAMLAGRPAGIERLVRALHYLAGLSFGRTVKTGPLRFEPVVVAFYPDLAHICPDYWPGGAGAVDLLAPPWNSLAAAAWFLRRVGETGKPPNSVLKGWVTTGNWWHGHHSEVATPIPAWRFQEGSLTHINEDKKHAIEDRRCDAFVVAADGRVMRTYDTPCLLGARALVSMGQLLWGPPAKPWDRSAAR